MDLVQRVENVTGMQRAHGGGAALAVFVPEKQLMQLHNRN